VLINVCCEQHVYKCLNTDFVGSTNTINICLILSTIYIFIPVSGCVCMGHSALLFPGPIILFRRPYVSILPLSTNLIIDFGIVPTMPYLFFLNFIPSYY
jgi:hypothetical protein